MSYLSKAWSCAWVIASMAACQQKTSAPSAGAPSSADTSARPPVGATAVAPSATNAARPDTSSASALGVAGPAPSDQRCSADVTEGVFKPCTSIGARCVLATNDGDCSCDDFDGNKHPYWKCSRARTNAAGH